MSVRRAVTLSRYVSVAFVVGLGGMARAETLPFEGRWDCGVGILAFTQQIYDPGEDPMEILDIAREGDGFVLTFAEDYQLALTMNPDGTMVWFSAVSGDEFLCQPLP